MNDSHGARALRDDWFDVFGPMDEGRARRVAELCVCADHPGIAARAFAGPEDQWAASYAYMHASTTEYGGYFRAWLSAGGWPKRPIPESEFRPMAHLAAVLVAEERGVDVAGIVAAVAAGTDGEYLQRIIDRQSGEKGGDGG